MLMKDFLKLNVQEKLHICGITVKQINERLYFLSKKYCFIKPLKNVRELECFLQRYYIINFEKWEKDYIGEYVKF